MTVDPWGPAGVGTVGLLVLEKDALVREGCVGQEGGDGPGSSPPKSSTVFVHPGTFGQRAEFFQAAPGGSLIWGSRLAPREPQSAR